MKRVGFLKEKMEDKNLIRRSIIKALTHKTSHRGVKHILNNLERYVDLFHNKIVNKTHKFSEGYFKVIKTERKQRKIQVPTLKDHIMQHIMMAVLSPIIMRGMYKWNCGVVPGRGPIKTKLYVEKVLRKHKPKYCLKLDIKEYFHNINTNIILQDIGKRVKDNHFLKLLKDLLDTANGGSGKGIPIGFYSSQWLSNYYLQQVDYHIKQEFKVKHYIRYMDDLVLLGNNKRTLHRVKTQLFKYLKETVDVTPNNKYQVFPIASRHIDFAGYLISYNKTKLRKTTFKKYKRRKKSIETENNVHLSRSYMSLRGWLNHSNIGAAYLRNNETKEFYNKVKTTISQKDKERYI